MSGKDDTPDSGIGSTGDSFHKISLSIKEFHRSQRNSIELSDVPDSTYASSSELVPKPNSKDGNPRVSVRALSDDDIQQIDTYGNPISSPRPPAILEEGIGYAGSSTSSDFQRSSVSIKGKSLRPSIGPPPVVIPLPFEVPASDDTGDEGHTSATPQIQRREPRDKRLSQFSMANRLSTVPSLGDELEVPHVEDDRRSSVAATLNEQLDPDDSLPKLSPSPSSLKLASGEEGSNAPDITAETKSEQAVILVSSSGLKPADDLPRSKSCTDLQDIEVVSKAAEKNPLIPPVDPAVMEAASASLVPSTHPKEEQPGSHERDIDTKQDTTTTSDSAPAQGGLIRQLPDKLSKIALSYRTNEWAKHLDKAEEPEDQVESRPSTPGVTVEVRAPELVALSAPAKVPDIQGKLKGEERPKMVAQNSGSSSNPYRTSKATPIYASRASSSTNLDKNNPTNSVYNINTIQRNVSQASARNTAILPQHGSQVKSNTRGNRSSSTPLSTQPLMESPAEGGSSPVAPGAFMRMNSSDGTLLGVAEKKQQNRTSCALLNRQSSSPNVAGVGSSNSSSSGGYHISPADDEDMPLSQRRSMIQAQRQSSAPALPQTTVYDSHQPKRASAVDTQKQAENLALWRNSVKADLAQKTPRIYEDKEARTQMLMQRRSSQLKQEQHAAAAQHRESMFDDMMRRGDMLDLHREKMRKMQASANRHAS